MQDARILFKTIIAMFFMIGLIAVSSWAFAQGGFISGSVKDLLNNQGIEGVIITVKDANIRYVGGNRDYGCLG